MCPTGALGYDYIDEFSSGPELDGFNDYGISPAIKIIPSRNVKGPEIHLEEEVSVVPTESSRAVADIRQEWPLIIFTLMAPILTGLFAGIFSGQYLFPVWGFLALSIVAVLISSFHLGRKERAWMAVLHIRESWLSIEIVLFSMFVLLSTIILFFFDISWFGFVVILVGLAANFSIDRVYDRLRSLKKIPLDSSDTLLTAILFICVFINYQTGIFLVLALKAIIFSIGRRRLLSLVSLVRIVFGFIFPVVFYLIVGLLAPYYIVISLIIGELMDRIRFYEGLDIKTPEREISERIETLSANDQ
jgi:DMSO reductase anchor subunit